MVQVFRSYPIKQSAWIIRKSARQLLRAGTGQIDAVFGLDDDFQAIRSDTGNGKRLVRTFDKVTPPITLGFTIILIVLATSGRLSRHQIRILATVVCGLLVNAAVFGGQSAPIDRYQSRMVWILPAICVAYIVQHVARIHPIRLAGAKRTLAKQMHK